MNDLIRKKLIVVQGNNAELDAIWKRLYGMGVGGSANDGNPEFVSLNKRRESLVWVNQKILDELLETEV